MQKLVDVLALPFYCGFIFWLSAQPKLPSHDVFENQDKLDHFLAYFIMGIIAWRAFAPASWPRAWLLLASSVFCSVYGVSDEWHQSFVMGRESSALDWLADTIGGLVAAVSYYAYSEKTAGA